MRNKWSFEQDFKNLKMPASLQNGRRRSKENESVTKSETVTEQTTKELRL